jgi:hypothetical protein
VDKSRNCGASRRESRWYFIDRLQNVDDEGIVRPISPKSPRSMSSKQSASVKGDMSERPDLLVKKAKENYSCM